MNDSLKRLIIVSVLFVFSLVGGSMGYIFIEGFEIIDAVYMAVITFSTVGFEQVNDLSNAGKGFTIVYIILNLGIFAYIVTVLSSVLFEGELQKIFHNLKYNRGLQKMKNHVIICGFGKNGRQAFEELLKEQERIVVIESDETEIDSLVNNNRNIFIKGNATLDETLIDAGIKKASTIISALGEDSDNVFITLTARELNPSIRIIAKATDYSSEKKLYRAGASHVVMPDRLGGIHMANLITKPYVIEFLELLNGVDESKLLLEEISHQLLKSEYQYQSLRNLDIRKKTGVTIMALKGEKYGFVFNPHSDRVLESHDVLIVLGQPSQINEFKKKYVK